MTYDFSFEFEQVAKGLNCPVCASRSVRVKRVTDQKVAFTCSNACVDFSLTRTAGIARVQELMYLALGGAHV